MCEPGVGRISLPEAKDDNHTFRKILTHLTNVILGSLRTHGVIFIVLDEGNIIVIEFIVSTVFLEELNLYMKR